METIPIYVKDITTRKVEVPLPYYSKDSAHHWKVLSPEKCIVVYSGWDLETCGVERSGSVQLAFGDDKVPCTEQEFTDACYAVLNKIKESI